MEELVPKYTWSLYLRSRFNLTTTNPLETASLGKMLHIFAASIGMLQMLSLILESSPLPGIISIFLNKIPLQFKFFFWFFYTFQLIWYRIKIHFIADSLTWNFIFIKMPMTCFTYTQFFIKWFHCIIQFCTANVIFLMHK